MSNASLTFFCRQIFISHPYFLDKKQQSTDQQLIKTIKKEVADNKTNKKQVRNNTRSFANEKFTHNWLKTSFKGHTGQVTSADLSSNGKYLASSSDGMYLFYVSYITIKINNYDS